MISIILAETFSTLVPPPGSALIVTSDHAPHELGMRIDSGCCMGALLPTHEPTPATISSGTRKTIEGQANTMVRFRKDLFRLQVLPIELVVSRILSTCETERVGAANMAPENRE